MSRRTTFRREPHSFRFRPSIAEPFMLIQPRRSETLPPLANQLQRQGIVSLPVSRQATANAMRELPQFAGWRGMGPIGNRGKGSIPAAGA
jgi:hypothetical protein